ncbi:MAG: hypothetical protein XU14_C0061G0006 [Armatimonadetes bacterium CSP1-3]|nr:MAG: hypothetical protein XU14_C0061G0006 [Armatimonadetes bacterium CSP1-3]
MRLWHVAALAGLLLLAGTGPSAGSSAQLVGGGLIWDPLRGKTIDSPSDFGFAVTAEGGIFVCSMAGPLTGGFKGLKVMTVEGPVTKGSLKVTGRTATFSGKATVVLVPGMSKEPVQVLDNVAYTVTVGLGGAGKAWLIMKVPAFTKTLGGDTGGTVKIGSITWK